MEWVKPFATTGNKLTFDVSDGTGGNTILDDAGNQVDLDGDSILAGDDIVTKDNIITALVYKINQSNDVFTHGKAIKDNMASLIKSESFYFTR